MITKSAMGSENRTACEFPCDRVADDGDLNYELRAPRPRDRDELEL